MPRKSRIGIDWDVTLAAALDRGDTARELARSLRVAVSSVYNAAKPRGVALRRGPSAAKGTPWEAEFLIALRNGESASEMARRLRVNQKSVYNAAKRRGISLARGKQTPRYGAAMTGHAIKSLRQRLGITQAAFGALYGLGPPSVISQWEIGRREPAGASITLLRLIERDPDALAKMIGDLRS